MHTDVHSLIRNQTLWQGEANPHPKFMQQQAVASTGIAEIDVALPDGGLPCGALHEWSLDLELPEKKSWRWYPPLSVLAHSIGNSLNTGGTKPLVAWINCTPTPQLLAATMPHNEQWHWQPNNIFLSIKPEKERLWAALQILRNKSVFAAVIDARKFSFVATRKLQLAASEGGAIGFLVRPPWEKIDASAAQTRWQVTAAPLQNQFAWDVQLTHARRTATPQQWTVEWQRTEGFSRGAVSIAPQSAAEEFPLERHNVNS